MLVIMIAMEIMLIMIMIMMMMLIRIKSEMDDFRDNLSDLGRDDDLR